MLNADVSKNAALVRVICSKGKFSFKPGLQCMKHPEEGKEF